MTFPCTAFSSFHTGHRLRADYGSSSGPQVHHSCGMFSRPAAAIKRSSEALGANHRILCMFFDDYLNPISPSTQSQNKGLSLQLLMQLLSSNNDRGGGNLPVPSTRFIGFPSSDLHSTREAASNQCVTGRDCHSLSRPTSFVTSCSDLFLHPRCHL